MSQDWQRLMDDLGPACAARSAGCDETDAFVGDSFATLKEHGAFAAGVPAELGGGDASHRQLCDMVRTLAHHCSSTALAFSMHTHLVATQAYLWRAGNKAVEPLLRRVVTEKLVLISTGGSDWLNGSGKLEKVEGGFRMTGRKIFGSGVPAGNLLLTTGVYDDPQGGPTVIHFPVALNAPGVTVLDTWRVLGMRGTGSHDIELANVFLPDAVMGGVRRPAGKWHPFMHTITLVALPVIYSAYLGVAEAARDLALRLAARRKSDPMVAILVGEMEDQLVTAQIAHASMLDLVERETAGPAASSATLCRRTIVAQAAVRTVEKALEVAGGVGFYRATGLERLFRDVQAARYHPLTEKVQNRFTGRHLLGLDLDGD